MATLEQRLRKLEQQTFKNVGTGIARVECDEEFRVVQVFFKTPSGGERLATPDELAEQSGLSSPTVNAALKALSANGLTTEITGLKRGRLYSYQEYLLVLGEGT